LTETLLEKDNPYWSKPIGECLKKCSIDLDPQQYQENGLISKEASDRLLKYGKNLLGSKTKTNLISLLASQFKSPIIIIFIFTSILSYFLGQIEDALIIIIIVVASGILGFWQEKGASDAVTKLLALVQLRSNALRDGKDCVIPVEDVVPGDIITLKSGDNIPADCMLITSKDLFVNEATLTGESYPVEKSVGTLPEETPIRDRSNCLFAGTFVVSGIARALVLKTGSTTELGKISDRLRRKVPETEFERGVRRFGYFLMEITLILVISILVINVYFGRPVLESFLFSLALAIGLTPQLLPAIISVNLAHGAKRMIKHKVIVKRLASIENLGSMNILCSDKTGTLTVGEAKLQSAIDPFGNDSKKALLYSFLNAFYETGFTNPIDKAIKTFCLDHQIDKEVVSHYCKLDEIPYDFIRKRLSIHIAYSDSEITTTTTATEISSSFIVSKGAVNNILEICSYAETDNGCKVVDLYKVKQEILDRYTELSNRGYRLLGMCYRNIVCNKQDRCNNNNNIVLPSSITKDDEINMTFLGFLIFVDPIKNDAIESIHNLKKMGISLKIISGDNRNVASYVAREIGLQNPRVLTGPDLHHMSKDALIRQTLDIDVYAEIEPNQKEQIILALRQSGKNVVGYMGDGINDASALHAADAGISVDSAADVVKEAADFVLLEKDLGVLAKGVQEGRRTFSNTLKYIFMATSANFGNMFSMAGASLFLPFLPLLPKQVLLMNLFTDLPEMTISTDNVDRETVEKPRHWDIKFIRKFMIVFGLLSTIFDYATFAILLFVLPSTVNQFRTAWFTESVISASIVVLVIRTRKPMFKSKPSKYLLFATLLIVVVTITIPFMPVSQIFGFTMLNASYLATIAVILLLYLVTAELTKKMFYKRVKS